MAVLPGGYGLALTTTWVGVPLMIAVTGVLAVRAVHTVRRYPWRDLFSLVEPGPHR